jgi:hypothetical protein
MIKILLLILKRKTRKKEVKHLFYSYLNFVFLYLIVQGVEIENIEKKLSIYFKKNKKII